MAEEGALKLEGEEELIKNMQRMSDGLQRKYNKQAVRKAGNNTAKVARKKVRAPTRKKRTRFSRTGLLAKSIAVKVMGKSGQPNAGAVIGPRKDVEGDGYGGKHIPAKVAHLVEGGHGGPYPAPPYPFLRPAHEETIKPNIAIMGNVLWAGIKKENQPRAPQ